MRKYILFLFLVYLCSNAYAQTQSQKKIAEIDSLIIVSVEKEDYKRASLLNKEKVLWEEIDAASQSNDSLAVDSLKKAIEELYVTKPKVEQTPVEQKTVTPYTYTYNYRTGKSNDGEKPEDEETASYNYTNKPQSVSNSNEAMLTGFQFVIVGGGFIKYDINPFIKFGFQETVYFNRRFTNFRYGLAARILIGYDFDFGSVHKMPQVFQNFGFETFNVGPSFVFRFAEKSVWEFQVPMGMVFYLNDTGPSFGVLPSVQYRIHIFGIGVEYAFLSNSFSHQIGLNLNVRL